jgi:pyruvate formate lyase activating enzyme
MSGLVFSIKRYSVHDGPGIRVTFFMKGCPLSCWWCHNPEGISPDPADVVQTEKVGEKEFFVKKKAGRYYSTDEILEILEKERIFIEESGGGATFSGGEPLFQPLFLMEALRRCRKSGYHTAVDTSGYASSEIFRSVMSLTDLFLFDLKFIDPARHLKYTGVSNELIMTNLELAAAGARELWLRIPVIPGINDDPDHLEMLRKHISTIKQNNLGKICLIPYHRIGTSKYAKFNIPYRMNGFEPPSPLRMKELKQFFEETGIKVKTGG